MIIQVYADEKTEARLKLAAQEMGLSVEHLAENAVSEAALAAYRNRPDDPANALD